MSVSIIIVTYYTGDALRLAVKSSLNQPECKELIIVDNGNPPAISAYFEQLRASDARVKILSGQGNIGFAKACNLGAKNASGDYLLMLNPDTMLPQDACKNMLAEIANYPANTLAGCYLQNPDGSEQRGGRRAIVDPKNAAVESLGLQRFFKQVGNVNYNKLAMPEQTHEVPAISGAFMFIAADFYKRLNGFDEDYFLHMEDMDFCYRVHKAGGKVICVPSVKVLHIRSTSEATSSFLEKCKAKSFAIYLDKHFSDKLPHPNPLPEGEGSKANKYSSSLLLFMKTAIWLRCVLKIFLGFVDGMFTSKLAARHEIARIVLINDLVNFAANSADFAGKNIVVTGSSSAIGLSIVGRLLAAGAKVIACYNDTEIAFLHPNLSHIQCDFSKSKEIAKLGDIKADILIHTAAINYLPAILPHFILGGVKRVIAFSDIIIAEREVNKGDQDKISDIINGEKTVKKICEEANLDLTVMRPLLPYGVGFGDVIGKIADTLRKISLFPIYKNAKGLINPVNVGDVADAAIAIIDNPQTFAKQYNLGGGEKISYKEMLQRLSLYLGRKNSFINIGILPSIINFLGKIYQLDNINGELALRMNRDLYIENKQAETDFNYNPRGFLQGEISI